VQPVLMLMSEIPNLNFDAITFVLVISHLPI
jgi:hypothetical protein